MTVQIGNLTFLKGGKISINLGQVVKILCISYEHRPTVINQEGEEIYGDKEECVGYGIMTTAEESPWIFIGPKQGTLKWGIHYHVIEDMGLIMEIKELFF